MGEKRTGLIKNGTRGKGQRIIKIKLIGMASSAEERGRMEQKKKEEVKQ